MEDKIIKILFIGDIHIDDKNPSSRCDNYYEAIYKKIFECFEIASIKKPDIIVLLGDLFNRMEMVAKYRNKLINLFINNNQIPIYVVLGNHDIKSSISNLPNSVLGTLIEAGIIRYVDEISDLGLGFGHFKVGIESDLKEGVYSDKSHYIWAFHANIVNTPMVFDDHVLFKDVVLHPNCKLVVGGHFHRGMRDENNGVMFINPGSICRKELNEYNLTHIPKVLLVEYIPNKTIINIELIPLKYFEDAKQVFKIDQATLKKDINADTKQYISQISKFSFITFELNKFESLRKSGKAKNIEDEVVELAIKTLEEVNGE
jgi:DNA repair exonuclease SbcCD nuclease subunit